MLSDYFASLNKNKLSYIRTRDPNANPQPFVIPMEFFNRSPKEVKQLIENNKEVKKLSDLRIMLLEYLKYRRAHSKELKNADLVMEKYLNQEEYFKLMDREKKELNRKNVMYRNFTGGQENEGGCFGFEKIKAHLESKKIVNNQQIQIACQKPLYHSVSTSFVKQDKRKKLRILRRYNI